MFHSELGATLSEIAKLNFDPRIKIEVTQNIVMYRTDIAVMAYPVRDFNKGELSIGFVYRTGVDGFADEEAIRDAAHDALCELMKSIKEAEFNPFKALGVL